MRRLIYLPLVLLMLTTVAAPAAFQTHAQSDDDSAQQILIDGNTQFAVDVYRALPEGNLIFSPYSISAALALLYAGARGDTAQQMADTLHFALPPDDLHGELGALSALLTGIDSDFEDPFQLNIANAVWAQDGYPLQNDYVLLLARHYDAGVQRVDFVNSGDDARLTINDWVSQKTNDRIPELLPLGMVSPASRLILTNAIYFNATWRTLFDKAETYDEDFTLMDGSAVQVPMMHMRDQFGYVEGDNYQAIALDYRPGADVVMMVILPDEGALSDVEAQLDAAWFRQTFEAIWEPWNLILSMPKFGAETEVELSETLSQLGMTDVFQSSADFTGIAEADEPLFINAVIHKAFIQVDEDGTEAAAATALGLGGGGPPNEPFEFKVNRPFIYVIYHRRTGAIMFMGRVVNPLES